MRGTASYGRRSETPVVPPPTRAGAPTAAAPARPRKKVLFVCIGNSCRSQMAEALARAYGSDVIEAQSAGLSPATMIAPLTKRVLGERNIRMEGQFPKGFDMMVREKYDVIVNMSGQNLQGQTLLVQAGALASARVVDWHVVDPIGRTDEVYRSVAAHIEGLVMALILELRAG
jgi:arsenate reductase